MRRSLLLIGFILGFLPLSWGYSYYSMQQKLSPEEFKQQQQEFMTKEASLTKKEASEFFPLFFELQDKKASLNRKTRLLFKRGEDVALSEKEYKTLLDELQDIRMQQAEVEKEYYKKFAKILSYEKIYRIQQAETKFHRQLLRGMHKHRRGRGRN
ncbi:MAG: hypothetical protein GX963_13450 [Bacteroidales bacterium]|nr:hypothetical protein [Bacteroidales bacterium]